MSPFATAHTFCASRDGPRKSGFLTAVPAKTEIFFVAYNYAGKADLGNSQGLLESEKEIRADRAFFRDN